MRVMKTAITATIDKADMAIGTINESVAVKKKPLAFKCLLFHHNNHYYIDRRIYLNLSKAIQSAAGLNVFVMCKIITLLFKLNLLYRNTFILL